MHAGTDRGVYEGGGEFHGRYEKARKYKGEPFCISGI